MRRLAIVPLHNAPGKRDVTHAFKPEAEAWLAFADKRDRVLVRFDNRAELGQRRAEIARELARLDGQRFGAIAFFCHGLWRQLQTGHTVATAGRLAALLAPLLEPQGGRPVSIPLYACDAAEGVPLEPKKGKLSPRGPGGDGGFADELRDAFLREQWSEHGARLVGGWIDAHVTTGHATSNPNVRRFDLATLPHEIELGMVGGESLVSPSATPALWRTWRTRLADRKADDLRLRFSTMTRSEIVAELARKP